MKFEFPSEPHEKEAKKFIEEFYTAASAINGDDGLARYMQNLSYAQWLDKLQRDLDIANMPPERVPSFTYFYVSEEGRIIGIINIRTTLNAFLLQEGGHIGYSIRPSERGKGYGKAMLRETSDFCRKAGIWPLLLVCSKENRASAAIIQSCGGILENETIGDQNNGLIQRYWIGKNSQN